MAVMMVVEMRPRVHNKKVKKIVGRVNRGFLTPADFCALG
jgi:hypothetical protein